MEWAWHGVAWLGVAADQCESRGAAGETAEAPRTSLTKLADSWPLLFMMFTRAIDMLIREVRVSVPSEFI